MLANDLDENSIINIDQVLIIPVEGCNVFNTPTAPPPPTNTPFQLAVAIATVTLPPTAVNAEVTITGVLSSGEINSEAVELRNRGDVINLQGGNCVIRAAISSASPRHASNRARSYAFSRARA